MAYLFVYCSSASQFDDLLAGAIIKKLGIGILDISPDITIQKRYQNRVPTRIDAPAAKSYPSAKYMLFSPLYL